jgi:membrane protein
MKMKKKYFKSLLLTTGLIIGLSASIHLDACAATHTVVKGDSLYKISMAYNTSVSNLMVANNLKSYDLNVGQVINIAYGFNTKKNFLFLKLRGILFTLALMVSMQVVFAAIVAGRSLLVFVKKISIFQDYNIILIDILRFAVAFFSIFIILLAAYKFLPYEKVKLSYAYPGAIFAAGGSIIGSYLYSRYASSKVVFINSIYGNLSGIFVFIIWIYILSIIFLMGAEVNYFASKQKK